MTERELYLRAAEIIRKRGLSIGGPGLEHDGPLCMEQTLEDVYEGAPWPRLHQVCGESIDTFSDSLPHKRDAIAALLIAADLAA